MRINQTFQPLSLRSPEPGTDWRVIGPRTRAEARFQEENMRKFALATAAVGALGVFGAPAFAQDVKVRIGSGDRGHHDRGHQNGWRHGDLEEGRDP